MNASNNLALLYEGVDMANPDSHAMNEPATKQDLYNQGILINSEFVKVNSQFAIVDSQFTNLRIDMDAKFDKVDSQFTNLRTDMDAKFTKVISDTKALLSKSSAANTILMIAILSIDRWWR